MPSPSSLPYQEPGSLILLVFSGFFLFLNIVNTLLNRLVYCGLVGQIFIGIAWGTPGAGWLSDASEHTILNLGYLGLVLLVYEGGLSTNIKTLRANLYRSSAVAMIGISCPIALSFMLLKVLSITPLQAFAAGAALCSTSLGTTFTVLSTAGLVDTRLGIVLSSAAMMDDVVGLVMVQVISNLGERSGINAITVIRPILVSIAFALLVPAVCYLGIRPLTIRFCSSTTASHSKVMSLLWTRQVAFLCHTGILLAMVIGASYAGTSNLFAAYLTGAAVSWWSDLIADASKQKTALVTAERLEELTPDTVTTEVESNTVSRATQTAPLEQTELTEVVEQSRKNALLVENLRGTEVYRHYYHQPVEYLLKPMFFASIGFSIPITRMFSGNVVWRGVVYAVLMTIGKLACGLCLLRIELPRIGLKHLVPAKIQRRIAHSTARKKAKKVTPSPPKTSAPQQERQEATSSKPDDSTEMHSTTQPAAEAYKSPKPPRSLYPAAILGGAMVSRGEIGFLISSIADARGIFGNQAHNTRETSELFLVVTWAILVCTVLGPLAVGLLVTRVRRLQDVERRLKTGKDDPLGDWGVIQ